MAIRRPYVAGLRILALVVAAMDHLFHPVFEFKHQMPERHGAGFDDFLSHGYSVLKLFGGSVRRLREKALSIRAKGQTRQCDGSGPTLLDLRQNAATGSVLRGIWKMPKTWQDALRAYRYPVIRPFSHAADYPQWKQPDLTCGDREQTKAFEDYFRTSGQSAIGPWAEVVFWKMASQGGRADIRTREVLDRWTLIQPQTLWDTLKAYVEEPAEGRFDRFRSLFGFRTKVIAIVATFPAFMAPDRFPMIDTRIAKWVQTHFGSQNAADSVGPQLVPRSHNYGLSMSDFTFMQQWTDWCRHTARKLVASTDEEWRARDVEMAVFQAQGDSLALNALPPL